MNLTSHSRSWSRTVPTLTLAGVVLAHLAMLPAAAQEPPPAPLERSVPPSPASPGTLSESRTAIQPLVPVSKMTIRLAAGNRRWLHDDKQASTKSLEEIRQELNADGESSVDLPKEPCHKPIYGPVNACGPYCRYFFVCHDPLYFEEIPLERYGDVCNSHLQPFISAGHFFGTLPLVPFKCVANHVGAARGECFSLDYMGNWRPGIAEGH